MHYRYRFFHYHTALALYVYLLVERGTKGVSRPKGTGKPKGSTLEIADNVATGICNTATNFMACNASYILF